MTDKELRKLTRAELLEMLISQMKENERHQEQVEELAAQLEDRRIMLEEAGSIAEASLRLNGVFQAAEKAAQQYLENIKRLSDEKITPRKEVRK